MPLIMILRFFLSLLSLAILGAAGYLLWTWYDGRYVTDLYGVLHLLRDDWRGWTGAGLLLWSFGGGGLLVKPFLAGPDKRPLDPQRGNGEVITGANGASLYVETVGPAGAPIVVLTHGWGLDSTIWAYAKRDLSKSFRVVLWDLPGMGLSQAPIDAISLESFAENLMAVVRHAGGGRVVLVGHSIGGMTTQTLARDHQVFFDRHIAGVVLVNTTYKNPLSTMILSKLALALQVPLIEPMMRLTLWLAPLAQLSAWKSLLDGSAHMGNRLGFGEHCTRSQLNHTALLSVRNPQGAQAKGNLVMFRWDATDALSAAKVPVLVLGGGMDILTKPEASTAIAASTPRGGVEIVAKVNHMGFLERADVYNEAIAAFATAAFAGDGNSETRRQESLAV